MKIKNEELKNFNELEHIGLFNYFIQSGHPKYLIKDNLDDSDIGFRDFVGKLLKLPEDFSEDPNGSHQELVRRDRDKVTFKHYFYYGEEEDPIAVLFNGTLFVYDGEVILKVDTSTIEQFGVGD
jgi:hypothetical protein